MDSVADSAQEASTETRSAADRLYRTCEETRDKLQRAMEGAKEELQKVAEGLREESSKITEGVSMVVADAVKTAQSHKTNDGRATYAEAVGARLPLAHPNMLARLRYQERQVLVDKDPWISSNHLEALNK